MTQTQQQNVPALRFPEFRGNWEKKTLGEIATFASGGTPSKSVPSYWNGNIPWISAASMHTDLIKDSKHRVTEEGAASGTRIAPNNTILLLVRGSMLFNRIPAGICTRTVTFNQDVKALSVTKDNSPRFLLSFIRSNEHRLLALVTGTGIGAGKLDTGELKALPFAQPTLPEQQKIASFLSAVDRKITQLGEKKALLQQYKKGCMQKLFSQQLRFKDDDGNDFPDWGEKRLGEVVQLIGGLTYAPSDIRDEGLLVLRSSNVQQGKVLLGDNVFVDLKVEPEKQTKEGDILLCVRNGSQRLIGKSAQIPKGIPTATHGAFMSVLRGEMNDFVAQLLQTATFFREVHKNLGATINSINGSDLKKFKFFFPSDPNEQQKIANFLSSIDQKIDLVTSELNHAKAFKKGLLQQMFV